MEIVHSDANGTLERNPTFNEKYGVGMKIPYRIWNLKWVCVMAWCVICTSYEKLWQVIAKRLVHLKIHKITPFSI